MKGFKAFLINRILLMIVFFAVVRHSFAQQKTKYPVDYVDNNIGVRDGDDASNCVIGPQLPFGFINPSPQTKGGGDDGYNPSEPIRGFGQLHVSGTGWGTNGQIFLSPQIGLAVGETEHDSPKSNEIAMPYEYAVTLDRYKMQHSSRHLFTAPSTSLFSQSRQCQNFVRHHPQHPHVHKPVIGGAVSEVRVTISGNYVIGNGVYRGGFGGGDYPVYFVAVISRKPSLTGTWLNGNIKIGSTSQQLLKTDPLYINTRKVVLSDISPFFIKERLPRALVGHIREKVPFGP